MTGGTLVIGVLSGMTTGLLAVGLVLVYKANRFINLAHAQLGALPAVLLAKVVNEGGIPFWVAFPLAIALGVGTAVAVERLVIAPTRARSGSSLRLLLLTIGLSQLLLALVYVPALIPDPGRQDPYPQPFDVSWRVGGVVLTGMDLLTLTITPLAVLALAAFLRRSSLGRQIRAAAGNPDSARLCGVSVRRVSSVTWGMAGGLAALSAVLAAPGQATFQGASLGPQLLLATLGAAALGAFVSLPAALVGGLVLGISGQVVTALTSSSSDGQLAVFVVILGFVVLRAKPISKVFAQLGGAVVDRAPTRIPPEVRSMALVRFHRHLLAGVPLLLAVVLPHLPGFASESQRFRLVLVLIACLLGVSLTILVGWAGQVSLGHGAVLGVGAFVAARLAPDGLSLPVLLAVAAVAGALLLLLIGLPALRVPGFTLSVATLGLAVVAPTWLFRQPWLGTATTNSIPMDPPVLPRGLGAVTDQLGTYYLALAVLVLGVAAASSLRGSVPGRLVLAVRDNERAVAALGVAPASVKLAILGISGAFAGAAGVLWATAQRQASIDQFGPDLSIASLGIPVIGGLGSLPGAITGAIAIQLPFQFLAPHLGALGDFARSAGFLLLVSGLGQLAVVIQFPAGIAGAVHERWQRWLDAAAERRRDGAASASRPALPASPRLPPPLPAPAALRHQGDRLLARRPSGSTDLPLAVEGIRLDFGGIRALDGAALEVRRGEIVGLIGPNGAGKSTLMNVVSGVQTADAGSVRLLGHEVSDLPPYLRASFGVARNFQDAALFGGLTVRQTVQVAVSRRWMVGFLPSMAGARWARYADVATAAEADAILARFGLEPWADSLCASLSTGTRRICDLACQVAFRPGLLLLDEPTGGVAQREAEAFGPLLRDIRGELDCSILVIEHDMPLLMGLCDRVYAMDQGRVIAEGTAEAVRNDPVVIARYLGTDEVAINRSGTELAGAAR